MKDLRIKNIKRNKEVKIIVNGKEVIAYEGETVLSALIANGFKAFRSSAVENEFRGGFCGMGVCYDCLVKINGVPQLRSCMYYVKEGMEIETDEERV